jgi:hypothetical protein
MSSQDLFRNIAKIFNIFYRGAMTPSFLAKSAKEEACPVKCCLWQPSTGGFNRLNVSLCGSVANSDVLI